MNLNEQQTAVVQAAESIVAVIAGPGSGKTATTIERIAHVIHEGMAGPSQIVVITFTNAAADEITNRLTEYFQEDPGFRLGFCGTLHAWMLAILRRYGTAIGLPEKLAVIDDETSAAMLEETVVEMGYHGSKKALGDAMKDVVGLLERKGMVGAELTAAGYHLKLIRNGLLDYDSILAYGLVLLRKKLTGHMLCGKFLFVDEYQDSGTMHARIYAAANFTNKTYVGDPDQSIFSFIGAEPKHIVETARKVNPYILDLNYRSLPAVCEAANNLIAVNEDRIAKTIVPVNGGSVVNRGSVRAFKFDDEAEQRQKLVVALEEAQAVGNSCAVLCKTNWQVQEMSDYIRAKGLPVVARKRMEVPKDWKKVRLFVAFCANHDNDFLAYQVLRMTRPDEAAALRREAVLKMTTLNAHALHFGILPVDGIPEALARIGIGADAVEMVGQAILGLPPGDATAAGLAFALGNDEALSKDEGDEGSPNPIHCLTIHSAKGKEFDAVFLPTWVQELFPAKAKNGALAEARRVAFVAVTRARANVWIGCPKRCRPHAKAYNADPSSPSQFVKELGITLE